MNISVCMATYNGERFIKQQLESILCQLAADDEVVISDDGSTDKTLEVVAALGDNRVRVLHHKPCGVPFNFENAIRESKGDFVFLSDQDDLWNHDKVRKCMAVFAAGADVIVTDADIIDGQNRVLKKSFFSVKHSGPGFLRNLKQNAYLGCCMAFRGSWRDRLLPFPARINMHDEWIGLLISFCGGKEMFIPESLTLYRQHGGNVTHSADRSVTSLVWKLRKRIFFLTYCIGRKLGVQ